MENSRGSGSKTVVFFKSKIRLLLPLLIFMVIYLAAFALLENRDVTRYYIIQIPGDQQIPFIRFFIIPYLFWFLWIPLVCAYLLIRDENAFKMCSKMLMAGMVVFVVFSALVPTKLMLRPFILPDTDIFYRLVSLIYRADTPTNVFPSIHVYNSCVLLYAVYNSEDALLSKKGIRVTAAVITVLICLSTMFLKQHSMLDVFGGIAMSIFVFEMSYGRELRMSRKVSTI